AQGLGELRAAGLAREHDFPARLAQALGVPLEMGALAGPVDALEADEPPPHFASPRGALRLSWYSRTARLCASSVSANSLVPSPRETKYSSRVSAGLTAASSDASPGRAMGVGGSPARV